MITVMFYGVYDIILLIAFLITVFVLMVTGYVLLMLVMETKLQELMLRKGLILVSIIDD